MSEVVQLLEDGAEFQTCDGKIAVPFCGEVDPHIPFEVREQEKRKAVAEIFDSVQAPHRVQKAALFIQANERVPQDLGVISCENRHSPKVTHYDMAHEPEVSEFHEVMKSGPSQVMQDASNPD
jgi:hypothetical protein